MIPLSDIRKEYKSMILEIDQVPDSPLLATQNWVEQAINAQVCEPTAMHLCTVSALNKPAARIVLLKGIGEQGLVFFTNYQSKKAMDISGNNAVCLTFFWPELERQLRIEGYVEKISTIESDKYYKSRPLGSRLGAWASPQSQIIENRQYLEQKMQEITDKNSLQALDRPDFWGGYQVLPSYFEFWQGRENRLHDRIAYLSDENKEKNIIWNKVRLAP